MVRFLDPYGDSMLNAFQVEGQVWFIGPHRVVAEALDNFQVPST